MIALQKRTSPSPEVADSLLDGLNALYRELRAIQLPDGMTRERVALLTMIEELGPVSVSRLAERAKVKAPTMSRLIGSLVDSGLVVRRNDKTDGRGVKISISAKGRRINAKIRHYYSRYLRQALGQLPHRTVSALSELVSALESLDQELSVDGTRSKP